MFMALSSVQINEMSTPLCRGASKIPFLAAPLRVLISLICTEDRDRKSTRLNSSHSQMSYAVFCLKKKNRHIIAQANLVLDEKGRIATELEHARKPGNFALVSRDEIDYVDVAPHQRDSAALSLLPL